MKDRYRVELSLNIWCDSDTEAVKIAQDICDKQKEKFSRKKTRRWSENPSLNNSQAWNLKNYRSFAAILLALFPALFYNSLQLRLIAPSL